MVYTQATVTLICFFYSLAVNMMPGYKFIWYSDPTFLVCLGLTGLNILITAGLMIVHKLKWEPAYNKLPEGAVEARDKISINTDDRK